MTRIPDFSDVQDAAERLAGHAVRTPLLRSDWIDARCGAQVWFKPECQQKVGAFKYRGAFNRLVRLTPSERASGVVAFSSGNHAQGVARAARELGIDAVIVMPSDAPQIKVDGVIADGATIVTYDRATESREEIAAQISRRDGRVIVPSFDDPDIIAGQGTVGLEIAEEAIDFDALVTCIGGGGLCAGISLAMTERSPHTKIYGAEPSGYDDHRLSLQAGERVGIAANIPTLCDALMTPMPGELTWAINRHSLSDVFAVSDAACLHAMAVAYRHLDLTLEPGGAVALASVLNGALEGRAERIVVILSGGNVEPELLEQALETYKDLL